MKKESIQKRFLIILEELWEYYPHWNFFKFLMNFTSLKNKIKRNEIQNLYNQTTKSTWLELRNHLIQHKNKKEEKDGL